MKKSLKKRLPLPVVPVSALSIGVLSEVGSKVEAGLGRLTPGTLAGVGQALPTCLPPLADERWNKEEKLGIKYNPRSSLLNTCDSLVADFGAALRVPYGSVQPSPPAALVITFLAGVDLPLAVRVLHTSAHVGQPFLH